MPSAVAKGQYYQGRTKRWLERQGYVVGLLQRMGFVMTRHGLRPVKRDLFGADLLAVSRERVLFVQVKSGETRPDFASARREFALYPLAPSCQQWTVYWTPRAMKPEVQVVAVGPCGPQHAVNVPARKKPKVLPLFARARCL
jgi:hypothetical protein